jgi:hypothetical protein
MTGQDDSRSAQREVSLAPSENSYEEYRSARERYFERLRVDSEIRRLERAWRLPGATDRR